MKKILFLILLLYPIIINAACDYENEKNMTSLSLYIDYAYEYNESTNSFDINIYNLQNIFSIEYAGNYYTPQNNKAIINNIKPGTSMRLTVFGSGDSLCSGKSFRTINLSLPFLNPYYESEECSGYENLTVCYSRFLNFNLSYTTFKNALKREEEYLAPTIEEPSIFDNVITFFKNNFIKIILLILTTAITFFIYKNKFRKTKHGF